MASRGRRMNGSATPEDHEEHPGMERWRGGVDERLRSINDTMVRLENSIVTMTSSITNALENLRTSREVVERDLEKRIHTLESSHTITKSRAALFAGIAGLVGGGLFQAAWQTLFHKVFGG